MVLSMNGTTDPDDLVLAFPARYEHSDATTTEQYPCILLRWKVHQSSIYQNFSPCKVLLWPLKFLELDLSYENNIQIKNRRSFSRSFM